MMKDSWLNVPLQKRFGAKAEAVSCCCWNGGFGGQEMESPVTALCGEEPVRQLGTF